MHGFLTNEIRGRGALETSTATGVLRANLLLRGKITLL